MELLIAFILISLLIGLIILSIKTPITPKITNITPNLDNSLQNNDIIKQQCLCGHNEICPSQEGICANLCYNPYEDEDND